MRMCKKVITALLCLALLAVLPLSAAAGTRTAEAEEVIFNLQDMEVTVGTDVSRADGNEPYVLFEADGSYTIELEPDAFFPYEVQFTCDGVTASEWFETPEDTVKVGGHVFRVHSEQTGEASLSQFGIWIGGEYVPAYPEAKTFTKEPQAMPLSLLPLEAYSLTVDLSNHLPAEAKNVQLSALLNSGSRNVDTAGKDVVWAFCRDGYDYTIADGDTFIDLLADGNVYSTYLDVIVGTADQLNTSNVRYRVRIRLALNYECFQIRFAGTDRSAISVHDTSYGYSTVNGIRRMLLWASVDAADYPSGSIYGSLAFADGLVTDGITVTVYKGLYASEEDAIAAEAEDITEQIWDTDPSASGYLADYTSSKSSPYLTMIIEKFGSVLDVQNYQIIIRKDNTWLSTRIYQNSDGSSSTRTYINYDNRSSDYSRGYSYETYYVSTDAAQDYYVSLSATNDIYDQNDLGLSMVEKAVAGEYDTLEAANDAVDIKEALFSEAYGSNTGGYKTKLNEGIVFTVFLKDGSILKVGMKVEYREPTLPSEPTPLSADTYFCAVGASAVTESGIEPLNCYVMPYMHDSYYYNGYQTVFILGEGTSYKNGTAVTATQIIPTFYTGSKVHIYAGQDTVSGTPQESGVTVMQFTSGQPIQYSAAAENGTHLKNYWVTYVTQQTGGPALFINGATNSVHTDEETGYPIREVILDSAHGNVHDIFFANIGDEVMSGLKVELDATNVKLDEYWTIGDTTTLAAFTTTGRYDVNDSYSSYGELRNVGKIRLVPDGQGVISGTLTISADSIDPVIIKLTGLSGVPEITTDSLLSGVKYVPYSSVIMTNSMGDAGSVAFEIIDGTLPAGVVLKPNGEIYGVPQVTGDFPITVRMTFTAPDGTVYTDEADYTLTIADNTDANVWNATDSGYDIIDPVGTENGNYVFVLEKYEDQLFWTEGAFGYFIDFWLDGERLTEGVDYLAEEGSTKITIYAQTFRNAGSGSHTIAAEFREGDPNDGTLKRAAQNYVVEGGSFTPGGIGGTSSTSGSSGTASTDLPFFDVPVNAWFYGDVKWAYDKQLMIGVSDTRFDPNSAVSQATIVTVLARMANVDLSRFNENPYPSIPNGEWYTQAAVWAKQTGILPTVEFGGEKPIGRGDMAIMLVNYMKHLGVKLDAPANLAVFADADQMTAKQDEAFQILYRYGVFKGMGGRRMEPNSYTTRAQFSALINRINSLLEN